MNKKKKYWYKFYIEYCPVCGQERKDKQRVYGVKPKDYKKIYIVTEKYDYCNS